jgi:hypothetical protein
VKIYIGDQLRADTNAKVYLQIFGDKGDSGEKKLAKSETHADKFEQNQVYQKTNVYSFFYSNCLFLDGQIFNRNSRLRPYIQNKNSS